MSRTKPKGMVWGVVRELRKTYERGSEWPALFRLGNLPIETS